LTTTAVQTALAGTLTLLAATDSAHPGVVVLIVLGAGCAMAIGFPSYMALLPDLVPRDDLPGALLPAEPVPVAVEIGAGSARITNGGLTAEISASGQLRFVRASGDELLAETTAHFTGPPTRRYRAVGGGMHRFEVTFEARDGERLYGLGQHQHGRLNQKGAVVDLVQRNTEVCIPFLVSNQGYGLLWNHPGTGRVELGTTVTRWVAEAVRQWDYWVTAADEPAGILRQYGEVAGARRCCRNGRPASGSASSATRPRTSC